MSIATNSYYVLATTDFILFLDIYFFYLDLLHYEDLGLLQQIAIQNLLLCPWLTLTEADNN